MDESALQDPPATYPGDMANASGATERKVINGIIFGSIMTNLDLKPFERHKISQGGSLSQARGPAARGLLVGGWVGGIAGPALPAALAN